MTGADLVIIGTDGMLGREVATACERRNLGARTFGGPHELDITDTSQVHSVLSEAPCSVVINAAGYTDVDGAESEPELADQVNRVGPANLARACHDIGAVLVHYSTDYVFDGRADRPYRTDDPPHPINAYGRSKLAGEREVVAGSRHLLIRTSWLFAPHGRNFVRTILDRAARRGELTVVEDQVGRPTYAADLAEATLDLLQRGVEGTVHAANGDQCSWFELAAAIVQLAGLPCTVRPCPTSDMPRPAPRPAYSVLDLSSSTAVIGEPRSWRDALARCLEQLGCRT